MIDRHNIPDADQQGLGSFFTQARRRIQREARSLGPYSRLPYRVGKLVTQEEVAEAASISRNWYHQLENAPCVHASLTLLGRVADALMLDDSERVVMLQLASAQLRSQA